MRLKILHLYQRIKTLGTFQKNSLMNLEKLSGDFKKTLGRFWKNSREIFLAPSNPLLKGDSEYLFYG